MQNKKKILFLITKGNFGGAQRYVFDLATSLPKAAFDIVVACGEGGLLIEKLKEKNIRTIEIESLNRDIKIINEFKVFKNLIKIIKSEKPDIIHLNSSKIGLLGSLAVLYVNFLSIIHNSKFIIHSVFTAHGWAFNENRNFLSKIAIYFLHWLTILLCNTTIAVSEKARKDIAFLPFVKNKIKVVYNGISEFETLSKEEARIILDNHESSKTIIFSILELHKNKGIDVALKAISRLPQEIKEKIIYNVAGDGEEKENLEKLAKELKIENLVKFLGFVPDAKKLLSGADIFLLPSRTEAFPYVILEAGFVGLPIIATSVGGIPEVIHDMQNGILIHPRNPKEISEAILYYLNHPQKMSEFGSEIHKTISTTFTLEKMIIETLKIY
jgi:glycosyltransferase involved in cell wall biosynthesis